MSGKKKAQKMGWSDFQDTYGKTRSTMDQLPTGPRPNQDPDAGRYQPRRGGRYGDNEEREDAPSRAEESNMWRSSGQSSLGGGSRGSFGGGSRGGFGGSDENVNRAEEASEWRTSRPAMSSRGGDFGAESSRYSSDRYNDRGGGSSYGGRSYGADSGGDGGDRRGWRRQGDDLDDAVPRRRNLELSKPSAERLQKAAEEQAEAKRKLEAEQRAQGSVPLGSNSAGSSAKPAARSAASNPFGNAKPVDHAVAAPPQRAEKLGTSGGAGVARYEPPRPGRFERRVEAPVRSDRAEALRTAEVPVRSDRAEALRTAEAPVRSDRAEALRAAEVPVRSDRAEALRAAEVPVRSDRAEALRNTEAPAAPSETKHRAQQPQLQPIRLKSISKAPSATSTSTSINLMSSLEKRTTSVNLMSSLEKRSTKAPVTSLDLPVDPDLPDAKELPRSALVIAMESGSSVAADDLAERIESLSMTDESTVDNLSVVLKSSFEEGTVAFDSALSILPEEFAPAILQKAITQLASSMDDAAVEAFLGCSEVGLVKALGLSELSRPDLLAKLAEFKLERFAPKLDISGIFSEAAERGDKAEDLLALIKTHYPTREEVPVYIARFVSLTVFKRSLAGKKFSSDEFGRYEDLLRYVCMSVDAQVQALFGAQMAWWNHGRDIKRVGQVMFKILYETRLVSVNALVSWMADTNDSAEGKKKLLFQVAGFIGDLQQAFEAADDYSDSDGHDSMEDDFPQANRNYDY